MAGLSVRSQTKAGDHLHIVSNAEPKFTRMTREAATAFPALATEDPALYQLMESVDVLELRLASPPPPPSLFLSLPVSCFCICHDLRDSMGGFSYIFLIGGNICVKNLLQ